MHILRSGSLALRASVTLVPASAGFCRYVHWGAVLSLVSFVLVVWRERYLFFAQSYGGQGT
jgi:hypothetical protein